MRDLQCGGMNRFLWGGDALGWELANERIAEATPLLAAFADRGPDRVLLADGREFSVQESVVWPGHHGRAVCIREL